jgi:peptidoglycan hydrolase-like protein with peptidoglycan-binding domain
MPHERATAPAGRDARQATPARVTPVHRLLGLQASAGNRAVSRLISDPSVQRCGGETHAGCPCAEEPVQRADLSEPGLEGASLRQPAESGPGPGAPSGQGAKTLTSPRFVGDATLEACLNDRARLAQGDVSRSTAKVQQALIDLGHDLGPTGADTVYGAKTAAAVRDFKAKENLGFTQFGDVGPGTMGRLDELFPGELPECPILGPTTETEAGPADAPAAADDRQAAGGASAFADAEQVRAGTPVGLAFGIPGLLCQIKPPPTPRPDPLPQRFGDIQATTRAALKLDTSRRDQATMDAGYTIFGGTAKKTGNLGSTTAIFGDGVPQGTTDPERDIRDGLVNVASLLITSQPSGLPVGTTTTVTINDVPGRKDKSGKPIIQPGGIFRFTHLQLTQGPHLLIERIGGVASRAPGAGTATTAAAFATAFAAEGFTLVLTPPAPGAPGVTSYSAAEIQLLDQGLRRHGAATLARINGTRFDRSSASQLGSEEGSYTPATHTINMVAKAFSGTALAHGGFTAGQFTLNHEVGHALADRDAAVMPLFTKAATGSAAISDVGKKNAEENFAECIALLAVDRNQLQAMRPAIFNLLNARYP